MPVMGHKLHDKMKAETLRYKDITLLYFNKQKLAK